MHFSDAFLLALSIVFVQATFGAVLPISALSKRTADNLPSDDHSVVCPGYRYNRGQLEKAVQRGVDNTPTTKPQPGGYPRHFRNKRRLRFSNKCNGKKLYQFPILHDEHIYGGGNPGADSVVFYIHTYNPDTNPTQDGTYCGVVTRDGAPEGQFILCPVEK